MAEQRDVLHPMRCVCVSSSPRTASRDGLGASPLRATAASVPDHACQCTQSIVHRRRVRKDIQHVWIYEDQVRSLLVAGGCRTAHGTGEVVLAPERVTIRARAASTSLLLHISSARSVSPDGRRSVGSMEAAERTRRRAVALVSMTRGEGTSFRRRSGRDPPSAGRRDLRTPKSPRRTLSHAFSRSFGPSADPTRRSTPRPPRVAAARTRARSIGDVAQRSRLLVIR